MYGVCPSTEPNMLWVIRYGRGMGYKSGITANQVGRFKNLWSMGEYGLWGVWLKRESTVVVMHFLRTFPVFLQQIYCMGWLLCCLATLHDILDMITSSGELSTSCTSYFCRNWTTNWCICNCLPVSGCGAKAPLMKWDQARDTKKTDNGRLTRTSGGRMWVKAYAKLFLSLDVFCSTNLLLFRIWNRGLATLHCVPVQHLLTACKP